MKCFSRTGSNAFVPTVRLPTTRKSVPIPGMSNKINRERGTKVSDSAVGAGDPQSYVVWYCIVCLFVFQLLDIDEVPVKRKRKLIAGIAEFWS